VWTERGGHKGRECGMGGKDRILLDRRAKKYDGEAWVLTGPAPQEVTRFYL